MKVFLDDERMAPKGWITVTSAEDCIALLKLGKVTHLSLDHDLGNPDDGSTGYTVLTWLEEQVFLEKMVPPSVLEVHSANISAVPKMLAAIAAIEEAYERRCSPTKVAAYKEASLMGLTDD